MTQQNERPTTVKSKLEVEMVRLQEDDLIQVGQIKHITHFKSRDSVDSVPYLRKNIGHADVSGCKNTLVFSDLINNDFRQIIEKAESLPDKVVLSYEIHTYQDTSSQPEGDEEARIVGDDKNDRH